MVSRVDGTVTNGAVIYRVFAREHLDASRAGTVALGERLTSPLQSTMEEFEEKLKTWDLEKERYKRMTGIDCANEICLVYP